jgi:hypothetical protein
MNNFSFIKDAPSVTDVDPLAPFLKLTNTVAHNYGDRYTQVLSLKKLKNNALDLSFTPNNGQSIIVAVSYDLDGVKAWINTNGSNKIGVTVYEVTSAGRTISTPSETEDKYVWVGIAYSGYIGYTPPNPSYTYSYVINGAVSSPESLLMFTSESAAAPTGVFDNPAILQPNSSNIYDSRYGSCNEGSYYFSFAVTAFIPRHLTLTPAIPKGFGLIVSTNKTQLRSWILAGGTGTLTNGGNYTNVGGAPLNVTVDKTVSATYYAAFYDTANIGADSCIDGNTFTVVSVQENESGISSGTYANPYIISNHLTEADSSDHSLSDGDCDRGSVYYMFEKCTNYYAPLTIFLHTSSLSQSIGVAYSTVKSELSTFIRTGNYSSIQNGGYTNSNGSDLTLQILRQDGSQYAFLVVYDPANIGSNTCTSTDTHKISTIQSNCTGGGTGRDGRYNNPFDGGNWSNVIHAEGDCDIDGTIWFQLNNACDATAYLSIHPQDGQNVRLAYGQNQAAVKSYIEGGGGGSGGGSCGYLGDPQNVYWSSYTDGSGNYYNNYGGWWESSVDNTAYHYMYDLPDFCGENCGGFSNPSDKYYSDYHDNYNYVTYYNTSYNEWYYEEWTEVNDYAYYNTLDLPGYCETWCGSFNDPYNPSTSDYFDYANGINYTYDVNNDNWSADGGVTTYAMVDLPNYCDPSSCGFFAGQDWSNSWYYFDGGSYEPGVNWGASGVWRTGSSWWQTDSVYINGITNLPNYCDGSGGGGSGGTTVMSIGSYETAYFRSNGQTWYAASYLPDELGQVQCTNFNRFGVSYYYDCYYPCYSNCTGGGNTTDTDPMVIGNNGSYYGNYSGSNECSLGNFYMRGYFCGQPFTMDVNAGVSISQIGWSNSFTALQNWSNSGRSGTPLNYGATAGGVSYGSSLNASNSFTGNLYFMLYTTSSDACYLNTGIYVDVSQEGCDGSPIGTVDSPIAIGNSETLIVDADAGNCFNGKTFMSVTLCSDVSASITITPPSNAAPQAFIMNDEAAKVEFEIEQNYVQYGGVGSYNGTVLVDSASTTSSPLVVNIPAVLGQRTLYFGLCDRFQSGNAGTPRCDRTGSTIVTVDQDCPITNIGGSADISGASRYDYDPYDVLAIDKRGVTLSSNDPGAVVTKNIIYIPTLVIDDAASYGVDISAATITTKLYVNSVAGVTSLAAVKATTKNEAIVNNNKVYVKPLGTYEMQFDNVSFYTALFVNTFETNVGTFVRNQVLNAGGQFTGGREQYAYVESISGNEVTAIVPITQDSVHKVQNNATVTGTQVSRGNKIKITMDAPQTVGTVVQATTSVSQGDGSYDVRVRI